MISSLPRQAKLPSFRYARIRVQRVTSILLLLLGSSMALAEGFEQIVARRYQ